MKSLTFITKTPVILLLLILFSSKCTRNKNELSSSPELINVKQAQVTIVWNTKKASHGKVYYKPALQDCEFLCAKDVVKAAKKHEVTISNLKHSTRYVYKLSNFSKKYQFQTQPDAVTPFSFLAVFGNLREEITSIFLSETPQFLLIFSDLQNNNKSRLNKISPYVPIYEANKILSKSKKIEWGGLGLIFIDNLKKIDLKVDNQGLHTIGIFINNTVADKLFETGFHSKVNNYNIANPDCKVAFVCISGESGKELKKDEIVYFEIDTLHTEHIRFDIDIESSKAVFINKSRTITLKSTLLQKKRTCTECRRLADKGAYKKSILAYEGFIKENKDHFQIDDAYYAIAEIYDEKLFDFKDALYWYNRLIEEFPSSSLNPLAKQRIKYISKYSDNDYAPLSVFERIKKVEYFRIKENKIECEKLFNKVRELIKENRDSELAPVMQYWLANQYNERDYVKAVKEYRAFYKMFPKHPISKEIKTKIGNAYYNAGMYKKALEVYKEALKETPSKKEMIISKIKRSKRNIRRVVFCYSFMILLVCIISMTFFYKPTGFGLCDMKNSFLVFIVWSILLFGGSFLIYEQFASMKEMVLFSIFIAFSTGLGSLISVSTIDKFFKKRNTISIITGSIIGILIFIFGLYLSIYFINMHYLVIFGV